MGQAVSRFDEDDGYGDGGEYIPGREGVALFVFIVIVGFLASWKAWELALSLLHVIAEALAP